MFTHTSSKKSPWYNVDANSKMEARLNCMRQVVKKYGNKKSVPLTGVDVRDNYSIEVNGVVFEHLNPLQYSTLKELKSKKAHALLRKHRPAVIHIRIIKREEEE